MSWSGSLSAQVIILLSFLREGSLQTCQVSVATPWEPTTHLLRDSSTIMSCTQREMSQVLEWYITPPGHNQPLLFYSEDTIAHLNNLSFYVLPEIEHEMGNTTQLLINSTEGKNGTMIECVDVVTASVINKTTLVIISEPISVNLILEAEDVGLQSIKISWNPLHLYESYTLMVTSENTQPQLHESLKPSDSFLFTAPEGAPPCDVYNFSVTATYDVVGATNTRVGCSTVLSRMLPSLPNKQGMEYSLNYSIERKETNMISIIVSVKDTSYYCKDYPITNYTLVVENYSFNETLSLFMAPNETSISTSNLSENTAYVFRMLASNSFGSISTDNKEIYTTDVQLVSAVELRDLGAFRVRCDFMIGSIAHGCMVVLIGELDNITVNFMRGADVGAVINAMHPTSCYSRVVAYDIESDGSVGSLPVPGKILADITSHSVVPCLQRQSAPTPNLQNVPLVLISVMIVVMIVVIIIVMICTILCLLVFMRKRSRFKTTVKSNSDDRLPPISVVAPPGLSHYSQEPDVPLYELPSNLSADEKNGDTCKSGSEEPSYNLLTHQCKENASSNQDEDYPDYAMLQEEHVYHVLENGEIQQKLRVVHSTCYDTPDFSSDKLPTEEFPIYQEVSELSVQESFSYKLSKTANSH